MFFQCIKTSVYNFFVIHNEDIFTCNQASVNNISDLKEKINSTIFGLSKNVQNYQIFVVIHLGCNLKDDIIIKD